MYIQVTDQENKAPPSDSTSYYVNNIANSLFDTVTCFANETQIGDGINYNYRAYAEAMVNYNFDYGLTIGPLAGFWMDSDPSEEDSTKNASVAKRREAFKDNNGMELCTRLSHDLFTMDSLIPPGVNIRVRLLRAKDDFVLISKDSGKKYKVLLKECTLMVRRVHLLPSLSLRNHQMLQENGVIRLSMRKSLVRTFVCPKGQCSISNDTLLNSILPERISIFMVKNASAFGKLDENPFKMDDFQVRSIQVTCNNGMFTCPAVQVNKDQGRWAKSYMLSHLSVTSNQSNEPLGIPWSAYQQGGSFISIWDLRDVRSTTSNLLPRTGTIRISLEFKAPLDDAVSVFVLSETSAALQIDKLLNVSQVDSLDELGTFEI